jgi:LEA14-like dessication related protein
MPNQCPQCGQVYDEQVHDCHQEGAEFIASAPDGAPRRTATRWKKWALVVGVIAFAMLATFFGLHAYMRGGVTITVESITVAEQDSNASEGAKAIERIVGAAKALFGKSDLVARLRVRNDTAIPVTIISARYTISLSDREIGNGIWEATEGAPARLPARQSIALDLPFQLEGRSLIVSVIEALTHKETALRVDGMVTISLLSYHVTVPFKASYTQADLPLEMQPTY